LKIISGILKGHRLTVAAGLTTRPTGAKARDALMQVLGSAVSGSSVADLFAGSGALGFEALSRGASQVVFYELDREAAQAIQKNIVMAETSFAKQGLEKPGLLLRSVDAFKAFQSWSKQEVVFADPPYEQSLSFATKLTQKLHTPDINLHTIACEYDGKECDKIGAILSGIPDGWSAEKRSYGRNAFFILRRE